MARTGGLRPHGARARGSPTRELIANPGCYPTATLLALIPLDAARRADPASSSTRSAGRPVQEARRDTLQASVVHGDVVAYGAPSHRHTAEIETHLAPGGLDAPIVFTPHLVPMSRGILATISAVPAAGIGRTTSTRRSRMPTP
jgi:N-acetyl-gamma-glutamyl-phosphate reductase